MRILVVEDEADLRHAIAQALREQDYAVDEAGDGMEGLYKAEVWDYDAIVLDLMLPKLDGLSLLQKLRKTKKTPVLILTARDSIQDRIRGLDGGGDDYLVKPFDLNELRARLRALIRRSAGIASPKIEIGDISIDLGAKTVTRAGQLIQLTSREYVLVELLALHRGKLVSRAMIYDKLFDENDDSMSNLVEVHVHNVRKKLGKEFIQTRRGLGYVVE
ncbi:MAG: response regulator transcription factor [Gemmataceae bacterium]